MDNAVRAGRTLETVVAFSSALARASLRAFSVLLDASPSIAARTYFRRRQFNTSTQGVTNNSINDKQCSTPVVSVCDNHWAKHNC
jgi:hypothetical protein